MKIRELGFSSCERNKERVRVEGVAVEAIVEGIVVVKKQKSYIMPIHLVYVDNEIRESLIKVYILHLLF